MPYVVIRSFPLFDHDPQIDLMKMGILFTVLFGSLVGVVGYASYFSTLVFEVEEMVNSYSNEKVIKDKPIFKGGFDILKVVILFSGEFYTRREELELESPEEKEERLKEVAKEKA